MNVINCNLSIKKMVPSWITSIFEWDLQMTVINCNLSIYKNYIYIFIIPVTCRVKGCTRFV